ncbi:MAG: Peptidoglycan-N-acetylglucosamine deacetylase [Pelotomaculum sp. PtaU1.Bin035]|nr:MAG: Peptidoglycan-N-acetylglucosamine deacetylase [Pelotomaculum sp. PtaU1.Bin035]
MVYKYSIPLLLALALLVNCVNFPVYTTIAPEEKPANADAAAQNQAPNNDFDGPPAETIVSPDPAKKVYLTFDDGPNSHYTGLILDILKKYNIKASFSVIGNTIDNNPDVFRRIISEGHGVVNHTYSHDYKKIYASPEAFLIDLEKCNQSIVKLTGSDVKVFRAPGGPSKLDKKYYDLLSKYGYISLGWNVTSADSDPNGVTADQICSNIENGVLFIEKAKKAPIILMHDGSEINTGPGAPGPAVQNYIRSRESDIQALPKIIEFLQTRGYTFAAVDEKTPPAW